MGARARVDSPRYLSGWVDPTVGLVDPGRLVWGLAAAAERLGVRLHEDTTVTAFDREENGVVVRTEWGSVRADRVVLGTGAFRGPLKRLALYTLPVYDHVLMSEPLSEAQLAAVGWDGREGLTDAGNQFHYYRRTLDDRVLFGGYDANYHFPGRIDPRLEQSASHDLLARHFFEIFPQLEGLRFTHRWAGVIDTTSRFTPVFGTALGGRLSYAVGYTGLGVASTRFGARVALDLVDGRDSEVTRLGMVRRKPMPFPPEPIRLPRCAPRAPASPPRTAPAGATSGCVGSTPLASASTADRHPGSLRLGSSLRRATGPRLPWGHGLQEEGTGRGLARPRGDRLPTLAFVDRARTAAHDQSGPGVARADPPGRHGRGGRRRRRLHEEGAPEGEPHREVHRR